MKNLESLSPQLTEPMDTSEKNETVVTGKSENQQSSTDMPSLSNHPSIQDTTVTPVQDTTVTPVQDTTVTPVQDTTVTPVQDTTVTPVQDTEMTSFIADTFQGTLKNEVHYPSYITSCCTLLPVVHYFLLYITSCCTLLPVIHHFLLYITSCYTSLPVVHTTVQSCYSVFTAPPHPSGCVFEVFLLIGKEGALHVPVPAHTPCSRGANQYVTVHSSQHHTVM